MMKLGHRGAAAPVGVGLAGIMVSLGEPIVIALGCAALTVLSSTWPDLADIRYKGRLHPGAALVRGSCHLGYRLRSRLDTMPMVVDEAPSHSLEWCVLAGVVVALLTVFVPALSPWSWWWGTAVTVGTVTHVIADWPTPSGVTGSMICNYAARRKVWVRHSTEWFENDSGGDKFLLVPALFLLAGLMTLWMFGWLHPIVVWMLGIES